MTANSMIDDLYRFNSWGNGRVLKLCEGLTDEQLDQPREIGFGSLRATIFHILAAEEIWLERWEGQPWRPFPFEPQGISTAVMADRFKSVAERRATLIDTERGGHWQRQVRYLDSSQNPHDRRLEDLLVHVANHGIHHRAQALQYLKLLGRTVPVGLDYLVYKLAYPSLKQDQATVDSMRQYGLDVETGTGLQLQLEPRRLREYFAYHDWAMKQVITAALPLDAAAIDRDFGIGPGSIRKTFLHLFQVEPWWLRNWTTGPSEVEHLPADQPLPEAFEAWTQVAEQRNAYVAQLNDETAAQQVIALVGGPQLKFRVLESMIQICEHGTHHRAQITNMLRHSGIQPPALDYAYWIRVRDGQA